jgi:putative tryptophan/tyrosine transport system substrate-binding protein
MNRRSLMTLIGGTAAMWPLAARAQEAALPVIGFLNSQSSIPMTEYVTAFRRGLNEGGFTEGHNVAIEYRWAESQNDRLPALAADLVRRQVAVIAATGATGGVAMAATKTIPIVFTTAADPVAIGLVASLNHPGGNVTGVTWINWELEAKQLELLHEAIPGATKIAVLSNLNTPGDARAAIQILQIATRRLRLEMIAINTSTEAEIKAAFETAVRERVDAVLLRPSAYFITQLEQIVALELRHRLPTTIVGFREAVPAGLLMNYGASIPDSYRQAGVYVGRILKGEKAADLPVMQPTKFELAVNLKTAKTLGLTIPPTLLAIADEVIE